MDNFAKWLQEELDYRDWKQADLARAANLDSAVISNLINEKRGAGETTATAIAKAFGLPPDFVFRKAGLLPDLRDSRKVAEEIAAFKLDDLNEEQLEEVIKYIDWIQDRDEKKLPGKKVEYRRKREGKAPPEVLKGDK